MHTHAFPALLAACLGGALAAQNLPALPKGYDPALWEKACRLHFAATVIDTHSDTTSRILDEDFDMGRRAPDGHMDLPRIAEGGLDAQFYSIYVAAEYAGEEDPATARSRKESKPDFSARRALDMIDGLVRTVERHPERMVLCTSPAELRAAVAAGRHAALMGIEGGHAIEGDLALLRQFHRLGVRYMTLTHTNHNQYADSCAPAEPRWNGINRLGVKVVREMNRLGMLVDVSHVSDAAFFAVLEVTRAPVILSHSSCRALAGHRRNVTDDMLRALARNGGVIMINFNGGFVDAEYGKRYDAWRAPLRIRERAIEARHGADSPEAKQAIAALRKEHADREPERPPLAALIDHIVHALDVAGEDHVGLGSDFDGVPSVPRGLEDVTCLPRITYELLQRGRSEAAVTKVLGGNLLRVFAAAEAKAKELRGEAPFRNDPATDSLPWR
ncbi:MAG: dipeptidase [Planctomycetes bacterium]|nr:dipeptidase [Planctomycetota bacterium]